MFADMKNSKAVKLKEKRGKLLALSLCDQTVWMFFRQYKMRNVNYC